MRLLIHQAWRGRVSASRRKSREADLRGGGGSVTLAPLGIDREELRAKLEAMAIASEQRRKAELARIESALRRLGIDEFGYCEICGEPIAPARLEHNPAVTTCISCAR